MRKNIFILLLILGMILPLAAFAQDEVAQGTEPQAREKVSLSEEQQELVKMAVMKYQEGDFKHVVQIYKAMLEKGESNYIWYMLGKSYAQQEKCMEAYDAYGHVATAPALDTFPPEEISDRLKISMAELDDICSAKVVFKCDPAQMTLSVDDGVEFDCNDKPVPFVPGYHWVKGRTIYGDNAVGVDLVAHQTKEVEIKVIDYTTIYTEPPSAPKRYVVWKWALFGGGLALMSIGTGLLFADDIDGKRTNNVIASSALIASGGAALIASMGLYIADAVHEPLMRVVNDQNDDDYMHEFAKPYKTWGWGLFGGGLGLAAIGTGVLFANDIAGKRDNNDVIGYSLVSLGGGFVYRYRAAHYQSRRVRAR